MAGTTSKAPKILRVTTVPVTIHPNYTDLYLSYGKGPGRDIGKVRLHIEDFADFLEHLRLGFGDIVITQAKTQEKE